MSGFSTTWPVRIFRVAAEGDCGDDGRVAPEVLGAWMADVVAAVEEACPALRHELVSHQAVAQVAGVQVRGDISGPGSIEIAGGVTEIRPSALTFTARYRPGDATVDGVSTGSGTVRLVTADGEALDISKELRDGLIELAHRARYFA
jgi:hypothetical protein